MLLLSCEFQTSFEASLGLSESLNSFVKLVLLASIFVNFGSLQVLKRHFVSSCF